ncbi:head processing protein, partial [Escherichia coli]
QGRHLEAMAKIADAEARIALLEETAGIRDDVLAAMQDELDNLPIFVSAAQKDAFRLKEPGDAKIVATLFESLIKVGARNLPVTKKIKEVPQAANVQAPRETSIITFNNSINPFK